MLRLITAVIVDTHDEWQIAERRYLSEESMTALAVIDRTRWAMRWKPALNAFAITFADRFPAAETY